MDAKSETGQQAVAVFGPETFVERVGDDALAPLAAAGAFALIDPCEPTAHSLIVAVRAGGPGRADAGAADGRRG